MASIRIAAGWKQEHMSKAEQVEEATELVARRPKHWQRPAFGAFISDKSINHQLLVNGAPAFDSEGQVMIYRAKPQAPMMLPATATTATTATTAIDDDDSERNDSNSNSNVGT
ncbi:hypothetical protein VC83_05829 [Pseudogymnoascus destructans]|nr:uncharacterized protein VC83_05829 [Pseudogymnoascus destructans]OAF57103.1 hypothetical protein VC83_05829 [Pseudogymnoascus destructans]